MNCIHQKLPGYLITAGAITLNTQDRDLIDPTAAFHSRGYRKESVYERKPLSMEDLNEAMTQK